MLDEIKILLGLSDDSRNELLETILSITKSRLKVMLGGVDDIPKELEYILTEVCIRRFNRIGSEGFSSHGVEGESISFSDNDFDSYLDDIQSWLNSQDGPSTKRGRIRFL